jgi:hypothetical protein
MFKTALRFLVLRVLPRRLIPVVTIVEVLLLLRSVRRRAGVRVNPPSASRTAPPAPLDGAAGEIPAIAAEAPGA